MAASGGPKVVHENIMLSYDVGDKSCYTASVDSDANTKVHNLITVNTGSITNANTKMDFYRGFTPSGSVEVENVQKYVQLHGKANNDNNHGNFLGSDGSPDLADTLTFDFTAMGWARADSTQARSIFGYRGTSFRNGILVYFHESSGYIQWTQRMTSGSYPTSTWTSSTMNLTESIYHHIGVRFTRGTGLSGSLDFYRNGEHINTVASIWPEQPGRVSQGIISWGIDWGDDDYASNSLSGRLGPFRHYTAALTNKEIKEAFESQRSRFGV